MAELLIFGGIALFSTVVGTGWYTCFYKPLSQSEEINPSQPDSNRIKIEESSSAESILNSEKITDRKYLDRLERSRIIIPGESIFENDESNEIFESNHGTDTYSTMNGMEGYTELPEHAISLLLEKNSKKKSNIVPSSSLNQNLKKKNSTEELLEITQDDGGIDLDKFLRKDQEIRDLEFEKSVLSKNPYSF